METKTAVLNATHYTQSQLSQLGQKRTADIPTATPLLYERCNGTGLPKRMKNPNNYKSAR